ncbi:MAG: SDR family oxidoreductase [Nostocaceae cyanobacterium]|nr:SDR family oxidoreductase [Nostocaceae cyanobacterium]
MSLSNKVAIITGASSGIGAAVAKSLDAAGMKLVLTARRGDKLQQLASQMQQAIVIPGDITNSELPQQLIDEALAHFGRCDVVFNNAGILTVGSIAEISVEGVCQMVRVNVEAAFRMAYVALKHFRKVNRGHLVNTSSVLGTKVRPTAGAYAGTKYAIEALSEALRMELAGTGIKVSCIEPGLVMTELHQDWQVHPSEMMNISHPLQPEDVAQCVRFLLEQPAHIQLPKLMILPDDHAI